MKSLKVKLSKQTKGRLLAINLLYRSELLGDDPLYLIEKEKGEEVEIAKIYLEKFCKNLDVIDDLIKKNLQNWDFERVLPFEKSVLRFGVGEILFCPDTPLKVIIEELLKITNIFVDEKAVKFINGVLDKIGKSIRK
ncbi:MAG: transcription antitermination factor NusB [Candidatus Hydrothermales bacterium]